MTDTDSNYSIESDEFIWNESASPASHSDLAPIVLKHLKTIALKQNYPLQVLDLGCGNGAFSSIILREGYEVAACDFSLSGISLATKNFPEISFFKHDMDESFSSKYQRKFNVVVSLEVIEHLYRPRALFKRAKEVLKEDGYIILSTPYHGYLKNMALALFAKFDDHWHPLRDFGHIKFFSKSTLVQCISECGFEMTSFNRVGRIPALAKHMVAVAKLIG